MKAFVLFASLAFALGACGTSQGPVAKVEFSQAPKASTVVQKTIVADDHVLALLRKLEATSSYDAVSSYAVKIGRPNIPVSQKTIDEVLEYQKWLISRKTNSTAVGAYQANHPTLLLWLKAEGVPTTKVFDKRTQDAFARWKLKKCGYYNPNRAISDLGNCLAGVWAALPMMSGPRQGKSRYGHILNNEAKISDTKFQSVLNARVVQRSVYATMKE